MIFWGGTLRYAQSAPSPWVATEGAHQLSINCSLIKLCLLSGFQLLPLFCEKRVVVSVCIPNSCFDPCSYAFVRNVHIRVVLLFFALDKQFLK